MKFTQGYELIYEKNGKFYGCAERYPNPDGKYGEDTKDVELSVTREDLEGQGYKLVYVKGDALKGSTTGIPSDEDHVIVSVAETTAEETPAEDDTEPEVDEPAANEGEEDITGDVDSEVEDVE